MGPFETIRKFQKTYPVKLAALAKELGIAGIESADLSDNVSGLIRKENDRYFVLVNSKHHINRQRFTVAHEIAHFILHKDDIGDGVADNTLYRSRLSDKIEAEANKLAAEILMPASLIRKIIEEAGDNLVVGDIAGKLEVSKSAASIRLGVPID